MCAPSKESSGVDRIDLRGKNTEAFWSNFKLNTLLSRYFNFLDRQGSAFNTILGIIFASLLGVLDILTPVEYVFSFFYLFPIGFTTWFARKRSGFLISTICTIFVVRHNVHMELFAATWNILSTLGIFTVVTILFYKIRQLLESESTMSRTDPLTGVMNVRAFSELMEYEILRLKRESSSFSIAYFDVDNFKQVNDQHGHRKGDELLKSIVTSLTHNLRKTDVIARMGGDEFIIYFPLTDQEVVKIATQKVREEINLLLQINNWPTTISMGVVTCTSGDCDFDELVAVADKLMYEVKQGGKNDVRYGVYAEHVTDHAPQ